MTAWTHPFSEGDRVAIDFNNCGQVEVREGTVVQVSETQPHITWVKWDETSGWRMIGTAHLRRLEAE